MPRRTTEPTEKTYRDRVKCPTTGKTFTMIRRTSTAGKKAQTFCRWCKKMHTLMAGPIKARKW